MDDIVDRYTTFDGEPLCETVARLRYRSPTRTQ
jgi:hypothetical protein